MFDHSKMAKFFFFFNPIALRKAKIVYNFGLSECNRVNSHMCTTPTNCSFHGNQHDF